MGSEVMDSEEMGSGGMRSKEMGVKRWGVTYHT